MSIVNVNTEKLLDILEKVQDLPKPLNSVEQATPTIAVSSTGLITASAIQGAGVVSAGTKSATKQLSTKGATTITPSDSEQTAVNAGTYVTGDIKVGAAQGKQVVTGTVTQSYNAANKNATISFAPGFNPTYAMLVCVTSGDGYSSTQGRGQYIMLKNGTWTSVATYGYDNIAYTATYSNGTVTLSVSNGSSSMNGTYQWVAVG